MKSERIDELALALAQAQGEMPFAPMNATNPFLKNRYADLGSIIKTAQPILTKNKLSYSQVPFSQDDHIGITTVLMHASGQWIESSVSLPLGDEKGKSLAQVAGSIISYLRRYSLAAMLGMYADEDTDGNGGHPEPKQQPKQKAEPIQGKIDKNRPYEPATVRDKIRSRATQHKQFTPSDAQQNLLRYGLELCFIGIEGADLEDRRHTVLNYLAGTTSTKEVDGQHFRAIVEDWLAMTKDEQTGDYVINQYAPAEAMAIYRQSLQDEGQQDLFNPS